MVIYKITNKINGKIYIGQTTQSIKKRWREHCKDSRNKVSALSFAIKKYGKENFIIRPISIASTLSDLNHREEYYIKIFKTLCPYGYNILKGGNNFQMSDRYKIQRMKKVVDVTTGEIYLNILEVCEKYSIKPCTIKNNIRGFSKTCCGRKFQYLTNWDGKVEEIKQVNPKLRVKIVDITTGLVYQGLTQASELLQIPPSSISYNLNKRSKTCHGRVFVKEEDWDGKVISYQNVQRIKSRKKVIEVFSGKIYDSVGKAAESIYCSPQSITDSLKNRVKLVKKQYSFEYYKDGSNV